MASVLDFVIPKFGSNGPTPTVSPILAGVGVITVVAKASLADGDYFTLKDGTNTVLFEYDVTGDGVTGGRTAIDVSAGGITSATHVRDATISAINGVTTGLLITASIKDADEINLTMDTSGPGDTNTENVTDAGFTITGMAEADPGQTWGFKLAGIRSTDSTTTAAGTEQTDTHGPLVADATNIIRITWTDAANWVAAGITHVQIWCTTGPGSVEGLVGTVAIGVQTFDYTGQAPTVAAASIPTANTTGDGTALGVLHLKDKTIQVTGTGTWSFKVQGSLDKINWVDEGAAQTAASTSCLEVSEAFAYMRTLMTAYTSGTPAAKLAGHAE